FSSRRRHTRFSRDWSSDVCSSDLVRARAGACAGARGRVGAVAARAKHLGHSWQGRKTGARKTRHAPAARGAGARGGAAIMKKQRTVTFNHNPLLKRELPAWRSRLVMLGLMGCLLALAGRALYLRGVNTDFLQAKGESRYARTLEVPATRGRVTDRQGDILAVSTPVRSVWAIPSDAQLEPAQA